MNLRSLVAGIVIVLLLSAAAYHLRQSPSDAQAEPRTKQVVTSAEESVTETVRSVTEAASDIAQASGGAEAPDDINEAFTGLLPGRTRFETLDGLIVKKERNCTPTIVQYTTDANGNVNPVYECRPHTEWQRHAYTSYPTEALRSLAYSDAEAAHELSDRLRDSDFAEAARYAMRAVALSGKTDSVRWLLLNYPTPTQPQSESRVNVIADHYILHGVLDALTGSDRFAEWSARVAEHEGHGVERAALDAAISSYVRDIETIRREAGIE